MSHKTETFRRRLSTLAYRLIVVHPNHIIYNSWDKFTSLLKLKIISRINWMHQENCLVGYACFKSGSTKASQLLLYSLPLTSLKSSAAFMTNISTETCLLWKQSGKEGEKKHRCQRYVFLIIILGSLCVWRGLTNPNMQNMKWAFDCSMKNI